jgi:hypothetical protein
MSGSVPLDPRDPRLIKIMQDYGQQSAQDRQDGYARFRGGAFAPDAGAGPVAPGTPYTGPQPMFAGAYNTLSPANFAAHNASLQAPDPNWQPPAQQQLPGLLDDNAAQIAQAKKLFDNPNGYWSGGEGSGGNGGGQR